MNEIESLRYKLEEDEKTVEDLRKEIKTMQSKLNDIPEFDQAGKMDALNEIAELAVRVDAIRSEAASIKERINKIKENHPELK